VSPEAPQLEFPTAPAADVSRGVIETLLVVEGRPLELARHLGRAAESVHALYGAALPHATAALIEGAAGGHRLARLRVVFEPDALATPALGVEPIDRAIVLSGEEVALATVAVSGGFGAHKLADRSWLGGIEQAVGEGVRALLVSREGALLESTRANVLLIRGGVLATPPLEGSILPGVVRARLLERARHAGITAVELPLTLEDLRDADAVLLSSSVRLLELARAPARGRSAEVLAQLREALERSLATV
jgi:para-aminobenzoate synthetase / 4-amino-4-deoxychorismate lyase